jgi:hypothetical protein
VLDANFATPYATTVATGSAIPFDKTYAQLSPGQKALVRSQYENMSEDDQPPYPEEGLAPLYRAVAAGQRKRKAEGQLSILVDIDSSGQAVRAAVYQTPDTELANYIAFTLMKQRYKAAICGGKACAMVFPFRIKLAVR